MDAYGELKVVVMDVGSHSIKSGFAGDDVPVFKGRTLLRNDAGTHDDDKFCFDEAITQPKGHLCNPVVDGVVQNWDHFETICHNTLYKKLSISPSETPLLISEPTPTSQFQSERCCQVFFETFNVPSFNALNSGIANMYSSGRTTGLSVEIGNTMQVVGVYEGYIVPNTLKVSNNGGGSDITTFLSNKFHFSGFANDIEEIIKLKEKCCYVASSLESELSNYKISEYILSDNRKIKIKTEGIIAGESLFKPFIRGSDVLGIHEIIAQSIDGGGNYNKSGNGDCSNCDIDCRRDFWGNIVLSGGTSLMKGFRNRLDSELNKIITSNERKEVISRLAYPPDDPSLLHSVFIGLSILGSLSCFNGHWLTKEEYDESGPTIIRRHSFFQHRPLYY